MSDYRNAPTDVASGGGGVFKAATTAANVAHALNSGTSLGCIEVTIVPSITNVSAVNIAIGSANASIGIQLLCAGSVALQSVICPSMLQLAIDDVDKLWVYSNVADQTVHGLYRR